jgi:hypothetical protein
VVNGLNLASGDTASIPFGNVWIATGIFPQDTALTKTICVVATSPNDHLDIFPDDNQWCDEVTFTVPVGIDEAASAEKMKVFPNPTTGIVHLPGAQGMMLEVLDATGRRVAMRMLTSESIDLRGMGVSDGMYVLRLSDGAATSAQRVILCQP